MPCFYVVFGLFVGGVFVLVIYFFVELDVLALWFLYGEFDPGSGRTLAACLTHASRTMKPATCCGWISGERVSNTWVTCPPFWDKPWKRGLIPNILALSHGGVGKAFV